MIPENIEYPPTIILRHRRENLKKCSLTGLETRPDCLFFTYPLTKPLPDLSSYILLKVGAPQLSLEDQYKGLFLIDATWNLASTMEKQSLPKMEARSLPPLFRTAYPRRQTGCPNPETGLASIEALYAAYLLLNRPLQGLLNRYYWKQQFLSFIEAKTPLPISRL